jgi:hypothetical protein
MAATTAGRAQATAAGGMLLPWRQLSGRRITGRIAAA